MEKRPPFDRIALLQGGGALGSYQGGVYQAPAASNLHPDWVACISIGAVNSALKRRGSVARKHCERGRTRGQSLEARLITEDSGSTRPGSLLANR
jgi:hypothetical protein